MLYTYYQSIGWLTIFKIVSNFEDVEYKMCNRDFKYTIYIVALVKLVKL
jgi:hypothetical protein